MGETYFAEEVEAQEGENHNPNGEIHLTVEQPPVIGLVGGAEELHSKCELYEAQHNLHRAEPVAAALLELLNQGREEGKQGEWKREGDGERKHGHHRCPEFALGGLDKHAADYRSGAAEAHQHECEGKEENASQTTAVAVLVCGVGPLGRQGYLERTEERCGEYHEYEEENDVRKPVRREPVENVGGHGVTSDQPCEQDDDGDGYGVQEHDEKTVHAGLETASCS